MYVFQNIILLIKTYHVICQFIIKENAWTRNPERPQFIPQCTHRNSQHQTLPTATTDYNQCTILWTASVGRTCGQGETEP